MHIVEVILGRTTVDMKSVIILGRTKVDRKSVIILGRTKVDMKSVIILGRTKVDMKSGMILGRTTVDVNLLYKPVFHNLTIIIFCRRICILFRLNYAFVCSCLVVFMLY